MFGRLFKRRDSAPSVEVPDWRAAGVMAPEFYTDPNQEVTLRIRQVPPAEIHKYCRAGRGCYDRQRQIITVVRITDDEDTEGFRTLGKEVWRALGGRDRKGV